MNPAALSAKKKTARQILDYIIVNEEVSRVSLAAALGVSPATVTNITTDLIAQGYIYESRQENASIGRKASLLRFNGDLKYVLNCEITDINGIHLSICNLLGRLIGETFVPCDIRITDARPESVVMREIISVVSGYVSSQPEEIRSRLCAAGLCIGGMVNAKHQIDCPMFNWQHVNLVSPLQAALRLPVYAEGVTRIKAAYEAMYVAATDRNIVYLNLTVGIGMVNFFNGKMVMGKNGISGEIGHITLDVDGPACYCGNRGCFEQYCGMRSILLKAEKLLDTMSHDDVFYDMVRNRGLPVSQDTLFKAAQEGSIAIHELLSSVSRYLGVAIATIYNIYDPDCIVVSSYDDERSSFIIDNAVTEARRRIVSTFSRDITITPSHLKPHELHVAISSFVRSNVLEIL